MRALICGGRDYDDDRWMGAQLLRIADEVGEFTLVIHGGARGADLMADSWAKFVNVPTMRFDANWDGDGRAAGPIRNKLMLTEGKPDLVVAFPGGRGTANMISQARRAGVRVIEVPARPSKAVIEDALATQARGPAR